MRTPLRVLITAVGFIAIAGVDHQAIAQQPPATVVASTSTGAPADAAKPVPEVTVIGNRAEFATRVTAYVNALTDFNYGDRTRGLARWQAPACPLVAGLPREQGEYILGRVTEIAQEAGVPLSGEKCRPHLFIIITKHPESDLRDLEKRHHADVFGDVEPQLINWFITTPKPIRAWYDTLETTPEGLPILAMNFPGQSQQTAVWSMGQIVVSPVATGATDGIATNPWSQASHLVTNAIWTLRQVFVVVDPTMFKGVTLGQLADYIAMAGLAQIKLDNHPTDAPTILTLFDKAPQAASPGLTEWDKAFLKSVYASEPKSVLARSQIAHTMISEIAP